MVNVSGPRCPELPTRLSASLYAFTWWLLHHPGQPRQVNIGYFLRGSNLDQNNVVVVGAKLSETTVPPNLADLMYSPGYTVQCLTPPFSNRDLVTLRSCSCSLSLPTGPLCPRLLHAVIAPLTRSHLLCKRVSADEGGGRRAGARRQIRCYFTADPAIGPAAGARRSARPQA